MRDLMRRDRRFDRNVDSERCPDENVAENDFAASSQIRYASGSNDNPPLGRHSATVHEQEFS